MKKFVIAVLVIISLASCSKKDVVAPQAEPATNNKIFYKDANVAIADVSGSTVNSSTVNVKFSALYEKNVTKIEIMSGPYENMLCFMHGEDIATTSNTEKKYSVTEQQATTSTRFYVIKYTLKSGGWVLTPAFKYVK
jgi:hypothetical protein